ncbi:MAG TPA: hypothetical protein VGG33_24890, partial [Polyangia bacterium]
QWGMVAAFAALSFREFGLLACAVGLVLALRNRRWPEAALWVAGIATYAVLMHFHLSAAGQYGLPEDRPRSWVGFGGSAFVVLSMQFTPLLGALPRWLVALLVPLALLGLAGWKDRAGTHLALVCFGYVAAFSVIGLTCNNYWGPLYAPLIYLGLAFAPESLRDLWRAARTGSFAINHQPFNVVTAERM